MFAKIIYCFAAGVVVFASAAARAEVVQDGQFAEGSTAGMYTLKTSAAHDQIGPWVVTGNSVDIVGSYWQGAPDGSFSVDLNGDEAGGIQQTLTLANGNYQLRFYLSGHPLAIPQSTATALVTVGDASQTFSYVVDNSFTDMKYAFETLDFNVTGGSTVLSFSSAMSGTLGPVIADVSVSPVPEPGSLAMLGTGMGLLAMVLRRRRGAIRRQVDRPVA